MNASKRTPGEWIIASGKYYTAIRSESEVIADMRAINGMCNAANASFIVKAVNAHDELVSIITGLLDNLEWCAPDNALFTCPAALAERMKAVLDKVKG